MSNNTSSPSLPASPSSITSSSKTRLKTDPKVFADSAERLLRDQKQTQKTILRYGQFADLLTKLLEKHDSESTTAMISITDVEFSPAWPHRCENTTTMTFTLDEACFFENILSSQLEMILKAGSSPRIVTAVLVTLDHTLGTTRCVPVFVMNAPDVRSQPGGIMNSEGDNVDFTPFIRPEARLHEL